MGARDDERRARILAERAKAAKPPPTPKPEKVEAPQPLVISKTPRAPAPIVTTLPKSVTVAPPPEPPRPKGFQRVHAYGDKVYGPQPETPTSALLDWSAKQGEQTPLPLPPSVEPVRREEYRPVKEPIAVLAETALAGDAMSKIDPLSPVSSTVEAGKQLGKDWREYVKSPEVRVRDAAREADPRERAQALLRSGGMKAILGLDKSASPLDVAKSLGQTEPDKVRLDHQRFLEQRYNGAVGEGQRLNELPKEQREKVQKQIAERAAYDVAALKTVGLFSRGGLGVAARDPNSMIDALKPTADVVGLDKRGEPVVRYESPAAYAGDVMTTPAYLTVSTGVPQAMFQTYFGASPDAHLYNPDKTFDPASVRERRTFLTEAFEANPYDRTGLINRTIHALPRPEGVTPSDVDEFAAGVNTVAAPLTGIVSDVVFPDPISITAGGGAILSRGIKSADKALLASKLERGVKAAERVAASSDATRSELSQAIKSGADAGAVEDSLLAGRDAFARETEGLNKQAKDAIEDAARVRTRAERAGAGLEKPMPYSATELAGTLDDAEKVEKILVDTPHTRGAAMSVTEGVNRTISALRRGAITPAEAAAYGERLFDTAHVTASALVEGVRKETQTAKAASASLLSALEKGSVKGREALDKVAGQVERAKATIKDPAKLEKATKALTGKAFEALHDAVADGGVPVNGRELAAFRANMVGELAPRLVAETPEAAKLRAAQMVDDVLLKTGKGDAKIHPETLAGLDALFRSTPAETGAASRTISPLRSGNSAHALLLGEGGTRNLAVMGQGKPTVTQIIRSHLRTGGRYLMSVFLGGDELAPFAKEGLTAAARQWSMDSARMIESVHADMDAIDTIDDAGRYLDGGQTQTKGLITSGKNRTTIFMENVELRPGEDGNVLDFVKAMLAPPIGRPEMLADRGWFRAQMAVIDAVQRTREAGGSGQALVEAIHLALDPFTVPHANLDGWTRRTTAWIAVQAEDVALLDRGFGDGIVLTEREHRNLEALAGGQFTLAEGESPSWSVERGLAARKYAGAGAEYTPVRIGSGAGFMEGEGAQFVKQMEAESALKTKDPVAKLQLEYIALRVEEEQVAKDYADRLQGWVKKAQRFEDAGDEEAIAAIWRTRPFDHSPWYREQMGEWAKKIEAAGGVVPERDISLDEVRRMQRDAGMPGSGLRRADVLYSRTPLSPEAQEGARYAREKVAALDPEGKNPVGAWRQVLDEMTSTRLDKMTERDKGIRAASRGEDFVSTPRRKPSAAAVSEYVEPFPELKEAADRAARAWSEARAKVVAEGGDPFKPWQYPELDAAKAAAYDADKRLRLARAEKAAKEGRVLYSEGYRSTHIAPDGMEYDTIHAEKRGDGWVAARMRDGEMMEEFGEPMSFAELADAYGEDVARAARRGDNFIVPPSKIGAAVAEGDMNAAKALRVAADFADEEGDVAASVVARHLADTRGSDLEKVTVGLLSKAEETEALGVYYGAFNHIEIAKTAPVRTVVHETVHAVTTRALKDPSKLSAAGQQAVKNLSGLYDAVRSAAPGNHYGFTSVDEFVAEAFSNPEFQEVLRNTPIAVEDGRYVVKTGGKAGTLATMWDAFVSNIANLLGFTDTDALGHVIANTNVVAKEGEAVGGALGAEEKLASKAAPKVTKPPPNPKLQQATRLYTQTLDSTVYVPKLVREKMTIAIARAYTPDSGLSRSLLSWWKLSVTRGALTARPGYLLNNVTGDFEQVAIAFGLQDALKTSIRTEGASIAAIAALGTPTALARKVIEPVAGPLGAMAVDEAWGLFISSFAGKNKSAVATALHASGDVGEKAAGMVSRLLGKSSFRIEVGKILEGGSESIRVGDHYYTAGELREAAIRYGVWDSFDRAELAPEMSRLGKVFDVPASGVQHIAETISLRRRLGLYVTLLEGGMKPEQAARAVTNALFDYRATMTDFEKTYISTFLLPFWSWQKNMNRLVIGSVASPIGAYRLKMVMSLGRAAQETAAHQDWFTGRPAADGDDIGLLTSYMTGPKAQEDYQAFKKFRAAVEAKEGKIAPKDWNALIWQSNSERPASLEWATRADVEPKLTADQVVNLRGYLARWYTPEMAKSYLRDRTGLRMRHLSTGPQLGEGEGDAFWNVYAPRSGVDGAIEYMGRGLAALYSVCAGDPDIARENLGAIVDVDRAPIISDIRAFTIPGERGTRRVAQGIAGPLYEGSEAYAVAKARVKGEAITIAPPLGKFLTQTSTVDVISDHPLVNAITVKDGVYTVDPLYAWIADSPMFADLNKRLLSGETLSGKGRYQPDDLRILLNAYGFQTPTVTTEDALREEGARYVEAKDSASQATTWPLTEGGPTSAE